MQTPDATVRWNYQVETPMLSNSHAKCNCVLARHVQSRSGFSSKPLLCVSPRLHVFMCMPSTACPACAVKCQNTRIYINEPVSFTKIHTQYAQAMLVLRSLHKCKLSLHRATSTLHPYAHCYHIGQLQLLHVTSCNASAQCKVVNYYVLYCVLLHCTVLPCIALACPELQPMV